MFDRSMKIQIKSPAELRLMRLAGLVVADALAAMRAAVAPGVTTRELDAIAYDVIRTAGRRPVVPRLPRLPGHDLRVGE